MPCRRLFARKAFQKPVQTFNTDNANQLLNITRNDDLLTVAGSLNGSNNFTINGQGAMIYHDLTFAATNGIPLNNGLNVLTAVAVSNGVAMTNRTVEFLPVTLNIAYDANGNLISDGLHGYDFDCANELARVTVTNILKAEFSYDGFGRRRIRKEFTWQTNAWVMTNEVRYVYDGMNVIQERDGSNNPKVSYTRGVDMSGTMQSAGGIGGLLARTDTNGSAYYHCDGNGNVTMLVSNSGAMLAKYLYDAFGNPLGMWGTLAQANTYRFSSMETYENMVLFTYRVYFPNLQRWGSRDPIEEEGGINLYGFVENNSVNEIDPLGLVDGSMEITMPDGSRIVKRFPETPDHEAARKIDENAEICKAAWDNGGKDFVITAATWETGGPEAKLAGELAKPALTACKRFADEAKLLDHFKRHGSDFGSKIASEYEKQASKFLSGKKPPNVLEKIRSNGDIVRYNPTTDEFGVISKDGTLKTYFKPDPSVHGKQTNLDYFNSQ